MRQVLEQETTFKMWNKLNDLFITKDLSNKMDLSKPLTENLDEFKNITSKFKAVGEVIGEENEVILF